MNTQMNTQRWMHLLVLLVLLTAVLSGCRADAAAAPDAGAQAKEGALAEGKLLGGPVLGTLVFEGSELKFQPAAVQVDRPGRYAVTFTNTGHVDHDLVIGDTRLVARPGETATGEITVPVEGIEFICSFPGHAPAGMTGRISVSGRG